MADASASSQRLEELEVANSLLNENEAATNLKVVKGLNGPDWLDSSAVVTAKTTNGVGHASHNGHGNHAEHHVEEFSGETITTNGGDERGQSRSSSELNDVIQNQLQPLLESVSLNGASMNELQQQLAAQFKQQNGGDGGAGSGALMLGNSNGSSSSTSPPLKTSESSISPAAQSTSHQISSASSSSIISSGSHSNNWNGQQQQSSLSSISPNDEASGSSSAQPNLLENIPNAATAAAWTSALNGSSQQQISPNQNSNEGAMLVNMSQQQGQINPAAIASLLKANNLVGGQSSSNMLNSIYSPSQIQQLLKSGNQSPAAMAALAALADSNAKMNGSQQQRSLITNSSNGIQPGRNGFIGENGGATEQERSGQQNGQLDLSMFNGHLVELIKNDPTQLEQILKLRNMYQAGNEETNGVSGTNVNGNTFMEELAQQLDQTVPANLAAAVAAAAAANSSLNYNPANSAGRNSSASARSMMGMQQKYGGQHHHHQHSNSHHYQQHNNNYNSNHHNHYQQQQSYQNNNNNHQNSMISNGNGHMMMNNHGYANNMQKQQQQQHQPSSYQHHHHYQQQQQQQQFGAYHPNQFAMNPSNTQQQQVYHQNFMNMTLQQQQQFNQYQDYHEERFSRKVFVGGLPPDIDEDEIVTHFRRYGNLIVDWPHKAESKSYFPPKGYAFLIFQEERNVQDLIETCVMDDGKLYMVVSSPSMKDKPVQIRPWCLADSDFVMDGSQPLDPRKTIFVGGVPRPLKAIELAMIMDRLYGGVCYAGIDTDPELKYPKGAGRVAFSNQQSYIAAISARFVQLHHGEIDKRVEVKPYVLDDQMCDECQGARCGGKFAPFFCANVTCLQYYCEQCWTTIHSRPGREYHKPLVKEGADRPRTLPYPKSKNRENYE